MTEAVWLAHLKYLLSSGGEGSLTKESDKWWPKRWTVNECLKERGPWLWAQSSSLMETEAGPWDMPTAGQEWPLLLSMSSSVQVCDGGGEGSGRSQR